MKTNKVLKKLNSVKKSDPVQTNVSERDLGEAKRESELDWFGQDPEPVLHWLSPHYQQSVISLQPDKQGEDISNDDDVHSSKILKISTILGTGIESCYINGTESRIINESQPSMNPEAPDSQLNIDFEEEVKEQEPPFTSKDIMFDINTVFANDPIKDCKNLPKFYNRLLLEEIMENKKVRNHKIQKDFYTNFSKHVIEIPQDQYNLKKLDKVMVKQSGGEMISSLRRLVMRRSLSRRLRRETLNSRHKSGQGSKLLYLIGSKVYILRCANSILLTKKSFK